MRVLHIGKYYPPYKGGMENFLKDLLKALHQDGISVSALVHHHLAKASLSREKEGGVPVLRVPSWGQVLYAPVSPFFPLFLKQAIAEFRPQILHFHVPNTSALWSLVLSVARSVPWVIQWQSDVVPSRIDRRLRAAYQCYRPVERLLLRKSEKIIVTSEPYLEESRPLKPWVSKCRVVPLGVDPERLPWPEDDRLERAEASWRTAGFKVLAVGRLTYYKGFEVLIQAVSKTADISLQIVGEGARKQRLLGLIASLGLQRRVVLRGALSDPDYQSVLATCDALCLPSLERTEAFGLVLLEAMRYGKALVVSDIPGSGAGWVVRKGSCGVLAPPGDAESLAMALEHLAARASLCRQLGEKGVKSLYRLFHIGEVSRQIKEIYEEIL